MTELPDSAAGPSSVHAVVVLTEFDRPAQKALQFAQAFRPQTLVALNVCLDLRETTGLIRQWARRRIDIPLRTVRPMADEDPVLQYIDEVRDEHPGGVVMVVFPVVVVTSRWLRPLHRSPDPTLAHRLSNRERVMVAEVPWHLAVG